MKNTLKTVSLLSLALVLGACGSGAPSTSAPSGVVAGGVKAGGLKASAQPGKWFVELEGDPTALSAQSIGSQQASFRALAAQRGISYQEVASYRTLFNGFSVEAGQTEIGRISELPGVKGVYPVHLTPMPETATVPMSQATQMPDMYYAKSMTGADIAQNELGLTGKGVKVGVIDTGLDLTHPAFKGRVVSGVDFVGDHYGTDGDYVPKPGSSPQDCAGHGTHVAGIVGGNEPSTDFKGVAPEASFGIYRVFGCAGSSYDDVILAAMERSYTDGMQVVNMSLGSAFDNWAETPLAIAASRMVKKGVVVVASAGNSGANGVYSMGGPTMGDNVISVASVDNTKLEYRRFILSDGSKMSYVMGDTPVPVSGVTLAITKRPGSTTATANDGCTVSGGFAANSLTGKAVLIRRGTCTFYEKASNAQKAGAAAVVLYNNTTGFQVPGGFPGNPAVTIPVVSVSRDDGAKIDSLISSGVSLTFTSEKLVEANPTANTLSNFTSYGASAELEQKPDVSAPGGSIISTYPLSIGDRSGYAVLSGTSMSSPHVAGAAALMLQAYPNTQAKDMRGLLMNAATLRYYRTANGVLTTLPDYVQRQGAGMLDIVGSYGNPVKVSPNKLSLGESATFATRSKVVVLKNTGSTRQVYAARNIPSLTIGGTTLAPAATQAYATMTVNGQNVDTGSTEVVVPPFSEVELNVVVTPPAAAADKAQYGGVLSLSSMTGSDLVVPYSGFKGDYQSIQVLGNEIIGGQLYDFPALYDEQEGDIYPEGAIVSTPPEFTFARYAADPAKPTVLSTDQPSLLVQVSHQARSLNVDLLDANGTLIETISRQEYLGRNCSNNVALESSTCDVYNQYSWDGKLANGSNAADGTYKLRVRVLKALGDASNPADTETYTSQAFTVKR